MTTLKNRTASLSVDGLELNQLRIAFDIERTLKPEPNDAQLRVYNLSRSTRKRFEQKKGVYIELRAGYGDDQDLLFSGDVRRVHTTQESPDIVTRFESGDGEDAFKKSRTNRGYRSGVNAEQILKDLASDMGAKVGNAIEAAKKGQFNKAGTELFGGLAMSGRSADELTKLTDAAGLEWSIQHGRLQLLQRGKALAGTAVVLSPETGLLGSPTIDPKGVMKCDCMLIPGVFPGRVVDVQSQFLDGQYRAERCQYSGDTHGDNWFITVEGKKPK